MRKTKEILRLAQDSGLSNRQIARSLLVSATTVGECLRRAREAGITWPLPEGMDDEALENALYGEAEREPSKTVPDTKLIHTELSRKGVTLALLWCQQRTNMSPFQRTKMSHFQRQRSPGPGLEPVNGRSRRRLEFTGFGGL